MFAVHFDDQAAFAACSEGDRAKITGVIFGLSPRVRDLSSRGQIFSSVPLEASGRHCPYN